MKKFDTYVHCGGGKYTILGISVPLVDNNLSFNEEKIKEKNIVVLEESVVKPIQVYDYFESEESNGAGLYLIKRDISFVIYQSQSDEKIWARPVEDFYGYKVYEDGTSKKRFTKLNG